MPAGVAIAAIVSNEDNASATVTLTGTPNGAVSFLAGRSPEVADATVAPHAGSGPYVVTLPHPSGWHVWVRDGADVAPEPGAVWVSLSGRQDADEAGQWLADTLWANRRLLDAAARQAGHRLTLAQTVYGARQVTKWPSLVILRPRIESEPFAFPHVWRHEFTFEVVLVQAHNTEQSEVETATTLGRAAQLILNQPAYLSFTLPSGVAVTGCRASSCSVDEGEVAGAGFQVIGTLSWRCEAQVQDAP